MSGSCCAKCGSENAGSAFAGSFCVSCSTFTSVEDALQGNLISALGPCVDSIRDLQTQFGARVYTVTLVWVKWSGGERGTGNSFIEYEERLMPTPLVNGLNSLGQEVTSIGMREQGSVSITEISTRFTEDLLMGRARVVADGFPIPLDIEFFWEVGFPQPSGKSIRRRFFPKAAPSLDPTKFEWKVSLEKAEDDRTRDGELA